MQLLMAGLYWRLAGEGPASIILTTGDAFDFPSGLGVTQAENKMAADGAIGITKGRCRPDQSFQDTCLAAPYECGSISNFPQCEVDGLQGGAVITGTEWLGWR